MPKCRFLFALFFLLTLFVSAEPLDFYPLAERAHWEYVDPDGGNPREVLAIRSLSREGRTYVETMFSSSDFCFSRFQYKADGFIWSYRKDYGVGQPAPVFLEKTYKVDLKVGDRWESACELLGQTGVLESEAVGREMIQVPAGKFETIKVVEHKKAGNFREDTTYWVASGVGVVKSKKLHAMNRRVPVVSLLKAYQLGPAPKTLALKPPSFPPEGRFVDSALEEKGGGNGTLLFEDGFVWVLDEIGRRRHGEAPRPVEVGEGQISFDSLKYRRSLRVVGFPAVEGLWLYFQGPKNDGRGRVFKMRAFQAIPLRFYGTWLSASGDRITLSGQTISSAGQEGEETLRSFGLLEQSHGTIKTLDLKQGVRWMRLLDKNTLCTWDERGKAVEFKRQDFPFPES